MQKPKTVMAAMVIASVGLSASAVEACQGVQFETHYSVVYAEPVSDIPDGKVQLKIRLTDYWTKQNSGRYDYFNAEIVSDKKRKQIITVPMPMMTSCGRLNLPKTGEYFIVGEYAKGAADGPLYIGNGRVFTARFQSTKPSFSNLTPTN